MNDDMYYLRWVVIDEAGDVDYAWMDEFLSRNERYEKGMINVTPEVKQLPWHIRKELVSEIIGKKWK